MRLPITAFVAPLLAVLLLCPDAPGEETALQTGLAKVARKAAAVLGQENRKTVALGYFGDISTTNANGSAGVQRILEAELKKLGVTVDKAAERIIRGEIALVKRADGFMVLQIEAVLSNRDGGGRLALGVEEGDEGAKKDPKEKDGPPGKEKPGPVRSDDSRDLMRVFGPTGHLPPEIWSAKDRNAKLYELITRPDVWVKDTRVKSKEDSPFAVEVLVQKEKDGKFERRAARKNEDKQAFVEIEEKELYRLVLHNDADVEVAARVWVDGIDVFHFTVDRDADGTPKYSHVLIAAKESATVFGWFKTADPKRADNYLSFLVTRYGEGAASGLPAESQGKVGVITVAFAKSFIPGPAAPRSATETGFGPPIKKDVAVLTRRIDPAIDFVSIRYSRP